MTSGPQPNDTPIPPTVEEIRAARRNRRSRGARNGLVIAMNFLFTIALFLALCAGALLWWGKGEFDGQGPLAAEATYLVPKGGGLDGIASGLERAGIISSATIFEYGVRLEGAGGKLKAGEYAFAPGASMRDVMETLRDGNAILHAVTVPEGWTVTQIFARLAAEEALAGDLPPMVPEGTLLPETYRFTRGQSRAEIVQQMSAAQAKLVKELWSDRASNLPISDIGQFVTLASIVEKETGIAAERPHVASVFINRLRKNMRLQSDPTIIYGIWGGAGKPLNEPIRQSHIQGETPYNTYVIRGLPPGPIANPGRAALEAVAHPLDTDDLYFVADGTGGHAFASTLDQHNANVRRYRAIERQTANDQNATGTGVRAIAP
ncbi:endolytic transglycosylase MltG [Aureimonas sp. AU4]|uniref:endolytic transglycosylase MltG n=1 Tax=Aureimonas sp. AU4 TaxID=1638163 RepID=UPI000A89F696|nr:endolytic transglycosylase MltG [Aureimonas sp. AU4]